MERLAVSLQITLTLPLLELLKKILFFNLFHNFAFFFFFENQLEASNGKAPL